MFQEGTRCCRKECHNPCTCWLDLSDPFDRNLHTPRSSPEDERGQVYASGFAWNVLEIRGYQPSPITPSLLPSRLLQRLGRVLLLSLLLQELAGSPLA